MRAKIRPTLLLIIFGIASRWCCAQGLSPRAYVIAPIHSNAMTFTYSLQDGNIVFDQTLPIANSKGRIGVESVSYFHTLSFFGRSANVNVSLPYSVGHFQAVISGVETKIYRSGLAPAVVRFSVNLHGAPAMPPGDFIKWKQKALIGASLTVSMPTGQYDPARFVNTSNNRWAFKPEVGFSRRWGRWLLDAYGAVWFFTANNDFYSNDPFSPGRNRQTEKPMPATELHLSYDVRPRLWVSIDGNYWHGGETSLNGVPTPTSVQASSRLGATAAIPVSKHHSLKFSYSGGTYVTFGGDYQDVSVAWQYSWLGRPK